MSTYENFQRDWDEAVNNFIVIGCERTSGVALIDAEARTGTRYIVVASRLGMNGSWTLGGKTLISVVYPSTASTAYPVNSEWRGLHDAYLMEKFCRNLKYGGDCAALVLAIRAAVSQLDTLLDDWKPVGDSLDGGALVVP